MAKKVSPWIALIKKQLSIVKEEDKLKGSAALGEAIKRAKKVYIKKKK